MQIHNKSIIMGTDKETVNKLIQQNQKTLKVLDELPLINGYVVEGTIADDLFKSDADKVTIVEDKVIPWIKPVKIKDVNVPQQTITRLYNEQPRVVKLDLARHLSTLEMPKIWGKGFTGKGVGLAILDSGISPHDDLKDKIAVFKDFTDEGGGKDTEPFDSYGHGTHVAGDAASSGKASRGIFKGPAYEATLIGLRIGDNKGPQKSAIIKAIQWVIDNQEKYNIRLANLSVGFRPDNPWDKDPLVLAIEKAYEAGILTCVAAGNEGPSYRTIGTPAITPHALVIGAMDENGTVSRSDDKVADFSSRGPTRDKLTKPNIISPGVDIIAPKAGTKDRYVSMDGTSMASPVTMGVLATWIQADPEISPQELIYVAQKTAVPIPLGDKNEFTQGKGMINPVNGLEMVLLRKKQRESMPT